MTAQTKIELACKLAMKYHAGQMYGKYSYMLHLEEVAGHVKDIVRKGLFQCLGLDREALICLAYLHDIIEDTDCSFEEPAKILEVEPMKALYLLSKNMGGCTYEEYVARIKANRYARIVKIADTWANLDNSWKDGNTKRIAKYTKQLNMLLED